MFRILLSQAFIRYIDDLLPFLPYNSYATTDSMFDIWIFIFFPGVWMASGLCLCAVAFLAKWILIGRYRPCEQPVIILI